MWLCLLIPTLNIQHVQLRLVICCKFTPAAMKRCVSPSFFFFFFFFFFLSLPPTQARKCGLNTIIHRTTGLCDNELSHVGLPPEISQVFYLFFLSFFSPFFF